MEPNMEVINSMTSICHAAVLSGMAGNLAADDPVFPGPLANAFFGLTDMSPDTPCELLAENPREDVASAIASWQIVEGETTRGATLREKGMARMADKFIRYKTGELKHPSVANVTQAQSADATLSQQLTVQQAQINSLQASLAAATSALSQAAPPPAPAGQGPPQEPLVALKEVISQTSDGSCKRMTQSEIVTAQTRWAKSYGDRTGEKRPCEDEDPTDDQLSSLKYLLDNDLPPYCDFATWVPHATRMQKRSKFLSQAFNQNGELVSLEILGPASFELWQASFTIYMNALIMLDVADLATLRDYQRFHERFHARYGAVAWGLQYQADNRCRLEMFPRVRRIGQKAFDRATRENEGTPPTGHAFDPSRPWNFVFDYVINDRDAEKWWDVQLERPANQLASGLASLGDLLGGDSLVGTRIPGPTPLGVDTTFSLPPDVRGLSSAPPVVGRGTKRAGGGVVGDPPIRRRRVSYKQHNVDANGLHTTSRSGHPLCPGFQTGACTASVVQGHWCSANYGHLHLCNKCLQHGHGGHQCSQQRAATPNFVNRLAYFGKGKGRGKGGRKGGGKGGKGAGKSWQQH